MFSSLPKLTYSKDGAMYFARQRKGIWVDYEHRPDFEIWQVRFNKQNGKFEHRNKK